MRVIVNGATGQMGQKLTAALNAREDMEIVALVSPELTTDPAADTYAALAEFTGEADMVIDFSNHAATTELLNYCRTNRLPVVIATTGQTDEERELIESASADIPVFFSANMSVGVAVTCDLARRAAAMFPDADIELVEAHHNRKVDVPSGTALMLANSIKAERENAVFNIGRHENGRRTKEEIGIHSLRLGNVVGMHEVMITTGTETITIKHEAHDRALFADGAIIAAQFLCGKEPGLYNMKDLMN